MNLMVITQDAPMYLPAFLDDFLCRVAETEHVVADIVALSPYSKGSKLREIGVRYAYYGLIDFVRMLAHVARHKLLSLLFHVNPAIGCHSLGNVLKKHGTARHDTSSVNSESFVSYVKDRPIDLIVSIAAPQIFRSAILHAPAKGCINYHTAFLPRHRGRQPLFWAMLNNEDETGISIHEMDEKLDNGPIIVQERFRIEKNDTLHSVYLKTLRIGPRLLAEAVSRIGDGRPERIENDAERATNNRFPTREDAQRFRAHGKRFF